MMAHFFLLSCFSLFSFFCCCCVLKKVSTFKLVSRNAVCSMLLCFLNEGFLMRLSFVQKFFVRMSCPSNRSQPFDFQPAAQKSFSIHWIGERAIWKMQTTSVFGWKRNLIFLNFFETKLFHFLPKLPLLNITFSSHDSRNYNPSSLYLLSFFKQFQWQF